VNEGVPFVVGGWVTVRLAVGKEADRPSEAPSTLSGLRAPARMPAAEHLAVTLRQVTGLRRARRSAPAGACAPSSCGSCPPSPPPHRCPAPYTLRAVLPLLIGLLPSLRRRHLCRRRFLPPPGLTTARNLPPGERARRFATTSARFRCRLTISREEWPSSFCKERASLPSRRYISAQVWRKVWGEQRTPLKPARSPASLSSRRAAPSGWHSR
jgi:hypothetical protein